VNLWTEAFSGELFLCDAGQRRSGGACEIAATAAAVTGILSAQHPSCGRPT